MKAKLFAIGLFLFALAACVKVPEPVEGPTRNNTPSLELQSIDTQMWRQPDSALTRLLPWFDTCCRDALNASPYIATDTTRRNHCVSTTFDRHYANLLLSELLYKNDYPQTNRRELQQAVNYFDSLCLCKDVARNVSTIAFLDARAHYINGVGYYENDSAVEACKEYMKALEVMEDRFGEKELMGKMVQFVALTYTRLSMLFSDMYLHEQAIYFAQVSISYYHKTKVASWFLSRMLSEIGGQYDMMNQLDSAKHYYRNAAIALNDTNSLVYRDIATHQVYLEYEISNQADTAIKALSYYLSVSNSLEEYLVRASVIGEIFYHERQFDSAWVYLSKVFEESERPGLKKQAAEWLVEICKAQGRSEDILEYADFLVPFANQEENQSEIKSQLTELYKAFCQSQHERQHEKEMQRHRYGSMMVFAGLFLVMLVVLALYRNNKRRKQHLEKQIKEEQLSHDMKQKALSGRLKQSNQKLQEVLKKIEIGETELKPAENNASYNTFDEKYKAFMQSQICIEILNTVNNLHDNIRDTLKTNADVTEYKTFALSLSQTAQLFKTVESFFPNFYPALKTHYATLDRKEWLHCCLYLLQLDKMSICVLLQEPYYTCRRCILKLEDAFDCRQGLSTFIIEQARIS